MGARQFQMQSSVPLAQARLNSDTALLAMLALCNLDMHSSMPQAISKTSMSQMHAVRDALRTEGKDKVLSMAGPVTDSNTQGSRAQGQSMLPTPSLQAINDTKIWAMKQRVDYETFKKMVQLQRQDMC